MRTVLKSKSAATNDSFAVVWAHITDYVTEDEAWSAVDKAAAEVRRVCGGSRDDIVYGWSGGKDSLALQVVMDYAGIRNAVLGIIPAVEWRSYLGWLPDHAPEHLVTYRNPLTLEWLAHHDRYVFPRTSRDGYWWALASARYAQHRYQADHHPALQILGRRTQDGNVCGDADGIHRTSRTTVYNPLRDWPHELVLAVIHYAALTLPPGYHQPHGWTAGTGAWPGRRVGTIDESWAETYAIEPGRVVEAAACMPSARAWLAAHA